MFILYNRPIMREGRFNILKKNYEKVPVIMLIKFRFISSVQYRKQILNPNNENIKEKETIYFYMQKLNPKGNTISLSKGDFIPASIARIARIKWFKILFILLIMQTDTLTELI